MITNKKFLSWVMIFLLFFSYLTTAGFIFQKFILEFFSQNNAYLLLSPESVIANDIAINFSEKLKVGFWENISLIPEQGYSINVSILAIFYFILGVNPYTNIIINSFFYSLSVLLLLNIFLKISSNSIWAKKSAFICSIIFLIWPSSLFLISQINEDFISTFSFLLLIFSSIYLYRSDKLSSIFLYFLLSFLALIFMYSVRDHFLQIQFIICFIILMMLLSRFLFLKFSLKLNYFVSILFIIFSLIYISVNNFENKNNVNSSDLFFNHLKIYHLKDISTEYFPEKEIIWKDSTYVPNFIDTRLQAIATINLINDINNIKNTARTPFNEDLEIESSVDFIKNLPLILYQGLFEPHPLRFDISDPKYLAVSLEMLFIYLCFLLILYIKNKSFNRLHIFIIASCFLYIVPITFTVATYGSLFRFRDPFLLIIALTLLRIFIDEYFSRHKK